MTRQQLRQSLRDHIFKEGSGQYREDGTDEDEAGSASEATRSIRQRLSRTGTIISKRASVRRSLNPLSRSSTSLAKDISVEQEDEEDVRNQIKQKAYSDKLAALNQPLHTTIEDDGVEETVISPIRRGSLMTPGLATRNPADILAKPPLLQEHPEEAEQDHYFNPGLSESSPLARIAALDLAHGIHEPHPRSATPLDVDYGNLGGAGALRITNGVASPVPSVRSATVPVRATSVATYDQDEYFSHAHDHQPAPLPSTLRLQELRKSGDFADAYQEYAKRQSGEISHGDSLRIPSTPEIRFGRQSLVPARSDDFDFPLVDSEMGERFEDSPDRTSVIAESYMLDLSGNPFVTEATTKPNEIEDDLFEDQTSRNRVSLYSLEKGDYAENHDPQKTLDPCKEMQKRSSRDTYDESRFSSVINTDSGYGSGSSSLSTNQPTKYGHEERAATPTERASGNSKSLWSSAFLSGKRASTTGPARPQLISAPTATTKSSISMWSTQNSSESIPTMVSTSSTASQSSRSIKRLQKQRPKSQPPPLVRLAVQSHLDITETASIPPVPLEIARRNAQRLRELPPLQCTLPSVDHEKAQPETVRSPPLSSPVRFPSPSQEEHTTDGGTELHKRRRPSARYSLLGSFKAQPRLTDQSFMDADDIDVIATLGDVTASLGAGPFDIAFSQRASPGLSDMRVSHAARPPVSASLPRTKNLIGMNDSEAAEVSRLRSMYRSSSLDAQSARPRSKPLSGPEKKHFNDRGGVPGKMLPPRVTVKEQPPLPSFPISIQVQMNETHAADEHHHDHGVKKRPTQRKAYSMVVPRPEPTLKAEKVIDWSQSRQAWAQRRKSAGEALVGTNAQSAQPERVSIFKGMPHLEPPQHILRVHPALDHTARPSRVDALRSNEQASPRNRSSPPSSSRRSQHHAPLIVGIGSNKDTEMDQREATASPSLRNLDIPAGTVARLSGRFDGGLGYGYEPGLGIGGSAGTRGSSPSKASRKSVDVSKGWGLDLSDIPVFISPNP